MKFIKKNNIKNTLYQSVYWTCKIVCILIRLNILENILIHTKKAHSKNLMYNFNYFLFCETCFFLIFILIWQETIAII